VDDVNAKYPWPKRQPLLFGRFSYYYRHVHPNVSETWRWVGGCKLQLVGQLQVACWHPLCRVTLTLHRTS
jgi:hypothetical protein